MFFGISFMTHAMTHFVSILSGRHVGACRDLLTCHRMLPDMPQDAAMQSCNSCYGRDMLSASGRDPNPPPPPQKYQYTQKLLQDMCVLSGNLGNL